MYHEPVRLLTFETLLTDPLTRLVMEADGVTIAELVAVMRLACEAVVARERATAVRVVSAPVAIFGRP